MKLHHALLLLMVTTMVAGCGANAVAPRYTSENPDIMRISEEQPANPEKTIEELGSYCVEVTETWNAHGETPNGQTLWAKDTNRAVVPCD